MSIFQLEVIYPKNRVRTAGEIVSKHAGGAGDYDVRRAAGSGDIFKRNLNLGPLHVVIRDESAVGDDVRPL